MVNVRHIAVLSVGRSDFSLYRAILHLLDESPAVRLSLLAGGRHEDPKFGNSIDEIRNSGLDWVPDLGFVPTTDSQSAVGTAIAEGTRLLTEFFERDCPDLLVVLGDRYEMLCGANASLGFNIPLAHIHGGAVTEGAIDELVRHALTKMSHLHFVSCDTYRQRLLQMGEEPWRVHTTGAPGLDSVLNASRLSPAEISDAIGMDVTKPTLLACYHPVTAAPTHTEAGLVSMLDALEKTTCQVVLTYPGADLGHDLIIDRITQFATRNAGRVHLSANLGNPLFTSILANVAAIVGNTSSGIVEAPCFGVPTVNIGARQDGKVKAASVIDVGNEMGEISAAIAKAMDLAFKATLRNMKNPYGDGKAGTRIADILERVEINDALLRKKFCDAGNGTLFATTAC
jgi:UDP-hydrolysing UDP-N-acetyl-D-glucosamine 2-epimerase